MIEVNDPVEFNGPVNLAEIIPHPLETVQATSTTPSVLNRTRLVLTNTGAVSITDFLFGQEGQMITVLGDGFTTLVQGTKIALNTGANKLLSANQVYVLVRYNEKWVELATSASVVVVPAKRVSLTGGGVLHTHTSAGNFENFAAEIVTIADLTNMTQIRTSGYFVYSVAGSLEMQYSTNGTSWITITGGKITFNAGSGQFYSSSYGTLNVAARITTCYLRIRINQSSGGDTVTLSSLAAEFLP